ncbi:MAG TPA: manganese efflux pump MntP family protein [Bacillales bacterium]
MHPAAIFEEVFTLFVMAFALGMDAFSVGLGMGMLELRLKRILKVGFVIGAFHMVMPLFGMLIGDYLSDYFGEMAALLGGILLLLLGAQMVYSSLFGDREAMVAPIGFGLVLFALSVSLDSFSVGLSLGIYGARMWITIFMFGAVSTVLTWSGLLMGRKFQKWLGTYSEILGGCILFAFGLKLLL